MALEEMRTELADLKHSLHAHQVELSLIDEKIKHQSDSLNTVKNSTKQKGQYEGSSTQLGALEKRVAQLEKMQDKIAADLRSFNTQVATATALLQEFKQEIAAHGERFDEVTKLKSTLTSLSKAMQHRSAPAAEASPSVTTYTVKKGDNLESIARRHQTTVETLKRLNHLEKDRITIGQELKISADDNTSH